jgi:hypothetical protein
MSDRQPILAFTFALLTCSTMMCTTIHAADLKSEVKTKEAVVETSSERTSEHRFWNRTDTILLSSHAGLEALDFGITHHNLAEGGKEMDSMAKALCESGTGGQVVFFGGRTAGVIGISYLLHRLHQYRMERTFIIYASGDSLYGVSYSFAHR